MEAEKEKKGYTKRPKGSLGKDAKEGQYTM
jgi:hypothetical protein